MKNLFFVIGTEAEIMKMYVVINKAKKAGFKCKVISTGQNDISNSPFMGKCGCSIDVDFAKFAPEHKTGIHYLIWMIKTIRYGTRIMKAEKQKDSSIAMIVHGDTLSTLLGSIIARKAGISYSHVEGGLRSYNWFNPFPEEIDRFYASKYADMVFCPNEEGKKTAERFFRGDAINTHYNTNIETLYDALGEIGLRNDITSGEEKYFVVAIHRQENLLNGKFMQHAIESIVKLSKIMRCVFIMHQQTEDALYRYRLREVIEHEKNIKLIKRQPYLKFIEVVYKSEFLLADGAGNQQEMYYLGKPYLILRNDIEKNSEGLGQNCIGYEGDFSFVEEFGRKYTEYKREPIIPEVYPSEIIVKKLIERYGGREVKNGQDDLAV